MNIFDQAMAIEKEGERLYRQLALEASDGGLKDIFNWLAAQEEKHYQAFQKIKKGESPLAMESTILADTKKIFEAWRDPSRRIDVKMTQTDLYRRALELESNSVLFYEKNAAAAASPQKEIFLRIAREEKGHRRIMENIIEFVTKPDVWVENAEFNHLEEDYYL